jgi:hypothetical protein
MITAPIDDVGDFNFAKMPEWLTPAWRVNDELERLAKPIAQFNPAEIATIKRREATHVVSRPVFRWRAIRPRALAFCCGVRDHTIASHT